LLLSFGPGHSQFLEYWNIFHAQRVFISSIGAKSFARALESLLKGRVLMKRVLILALLLATAIAAPPLARQAQNPHVAKMTLKVGDAAPDFTLLSD